jgi:hypothetical protein
LGKSLSPGKLKPSQLAYPRRRPRHHPKEIPMNRCLSSSLMFAIAACAVSAACVIRAVCEPAIERVAAVWRRAKELVLGGLQLSASPGTEPQPAVWRFKVKAFILRIAKRERPVMTSNWRMCPSI